MSNLHVPTHEWVTNTKSGQIPQTGSNTGNHIWWFKTRYTIFQWSSTVQYVNAYLHVLIPFEDKNYWRKHAVFWFQLLSFVHNTDVSKPRACVKVVMWLQWSIRKRSTLSLNIIMRREGVLWMRSAIQDIKTSYFIVYMFWYELVFVILILLDFTTSPVCHHVKKVIYLYWFIKYPQI